MSNKSKIITFSVSSLIMLSAMFFFFEVPGKYSATLEQRFWSRKVMHGKTNLIALGDSRVYRGLNMDAFSKLDSNGINFGFSAGGLNDFMYNEVERQLIQNYDSCIIIIGVSARALTPETESNQHYNQEKKRSEFEKVLYTRFGKIMSRFDPVGPYQLYKKYVKGGPMYTKGYVYHDNGWAETILSYSELDELTNLNQNFDGNNVKPELIDEMIDRVQEWSEKGVHVYGYYPPVPLETREIESQVGFDSTAIKKRFIAAGGIWLNFNPDAYRTYDGVHLTGKEARRLSKKMAARIEEIESELRGE